MNTLRKSLTLEFINNSCFYSNRTKLPYILAGVLKTTKASRRVQIPAVKQTSPWMFKRRHHILGEARISSRNPSIFLEFTKDLKCSLT